jgi:hypothetical protein
MVESAKPRASAAALHGQNAIRATARLASALTRAESNPFDAKKPVPDWSLTGADWLWGDELLTAGKRK